MTQRCAALMTMFGFICAIFVQQGIIRLNDVEIIADRKKLLAEVCQILNLPMPQMAENNTETITIPVAQFKPKNRQFFGRVRHSVSPQNNST